VGGDGGNWRRWRAAALGFADGAAESV